MTGDEGGSVSHWLLELKQGDRTAVSPLWERYYGRLVSLARARLRQLRHHGADADEEDAALSAFNSFCAGAARGRFPDISDREDLWRLLVTITARKAFAQARHDRRLKRGGGRVVEASTLAHGGSPSGEDSALGPGLDMLAGDEPTPEFAAMVAEEYRRLLDALHDDSLRLVAVSRMEGYSCDEIATRLGCAKRTVARRLDLIRKTWIASDEGP